MFHYSLIISIAYMISGKVGQVPRVPVLGLVLILREAGCWGLQNGKAAAQAQHHSVGYSRATQDTMPVSIHMERREV